MKAKVPVAAFLKEFSNRSELLYPASSAIPAIAYFEDGG